MALGNLTYKTPNAINKIAQDLSGSEGCALKLDAQGVVSLAVTQGSVPYGIVVVGSASTISSADCATTPCAFVVEFVEAQ
jgi:hypothetical protein